jgi:hypothetical protein
MPAVDTTLPPLVTSNLSLLNIKVNTVVQNNFYAWLKLINKS